MVINDDEQKRNARTWVPGSQAGHNLCSRRIPLLIQFDADDQKAQLSEQRAAPEGPFSELCCDTWECMYMYLYILTYTHKKIRHCMNS